jgi:hypothetical protein
VIKGSEKQRKDAESACEMFGRRVIANLEERFSDAEDSKILRAFCCMFDPAVFSSPEHMLRVSY